MTDSHFILDVHPASVRAAARRLHRVIEALDPMPARILRTPDDIGDQWTGGPATRVKAEMTALGGAITEAEPLLREAHRALKDLAQAYDNALDRLPALNRRWDDALGEHAESVDKVTQDQAKALKDAAKDDKPVDQETTDKITTQATQGIDGAATALRTAQTSLTTQFDGLRDDVLRDTRTAAAALYGAMLIKAPLWAQAIALADLGEQPRGVMWGELARKELGLDLGLVSAHYQAVDEAEEWDEALDPHGIPAPTTYDVEHGQELVSELDAKLDELDGLDAAKKSKLINRWAEALPVEDLALLAVLDSARVGNLDGIPNRARYAANRVNLADGIEAERAQLEKYWNPPPDETHERWAEYSRLKDRIEQLEGLLEDVTSTDPSTGKLVTKPPHQTLVFVPPTYDGDKVVDDGRLAVVMGDLDKAKFVGTVVPGITNRIDNFQATLDKATNLHNSVPGSATIAWLGYDTPEFSDASSPDKAEVGGMALKNFVDGLVRSEGSEITVLAHSYGTLVTSKALQAGMIVDRVALFGSPGLGDNILGKDDLGIPDNLDIPIYAMRAPGDPVSITAGHGMDPVDMPGIIRLDTDWMGVEDVTGHSQYTVEQTQALENLAGVLRGWTTTPNQWGTHLVTGGNALAEDGFAGEYNQNVRNLVDILQTEVPPEVLESFVAKFEPELQNLGEKGTPVASIDDVDQLIQLLRDAREDSRIGDYLTTEEFGDALVKAGFVDQAATDAGDWVEDNIDRWDGLDDVVIPVPVGHGPPIMVPLPDGINEMLGDRAGDLSEDAVRGLGEDLAHHIPGFSDVLDGAGTVVDGVELLHDGVQGLAGAGRSANDFREAAQDTVLDGIDTTQDAVVDGVREIAGATERGAKATGRAVDDAVDTAADRGRDVFEALGDLEPEDFRLRNPLPFG